VTDESVILFILFYLLGYAWPLDMGVDADANKSTWVDWKVSKSNWLAFMLLDRIFSKKWLQPHTGLLNVNSSKILEASAFRKPVKSILNWKSIGLLLSWVELFWFYAVDVKSILKSNVGQVESICQIQSLPGLPRVLRIDPLCLLPGCRKRRLNQAPLNLRGLIWLLMMDWSERGNIRKRGPSWEPFRKNSALFSWQANQSTKAHEETERSTI